MNYQDKRLARFESIAGIERSDIPVAAEIWLADICGSCWADRSIIKLATLLTRYMREPEPEKLKFNALEYSCGLDRQQVSDTLRILVIYGAASGYDCSGDTLKVGLCLSYLQRLRVLEACSSFRDLRPGTTMADLPWRKQDRDRWLPSRNSAPATSQSVGSQSVGSQSATSHSENTESDNSDTDTTRKDAA